MPLNTSDERAASIPAVSHFFRSRGFEAQNFTKSCVQYNTYLYSIHIFCCLSVFSFYFFHGLKLCSRTRQFKIHIHILRLCASFYFCLHRDWWRQEEIAKHKSTNVSHGGRMEKKKEKKRKAVRVPLAYHWGRQYGPTCNNRHHHEPGTALQSLRLWTWWGSRGDSELARSCGRGRGSPESEMKGCSAALVWRGPRAWVKRLRLKGVPCHPSLVLDIPDKGRETEGRD